MSKFQDFVGAIASNNFRGRAGEEVIKAVKNGELTSGATFTRDDTANEFDSDGIMQTAAADTPRTTYIDGVPLLWIDGAVTEISGRSADLDNWGTNAGAAKDAVGLDGANNTGWTVTDDDAGTTEFIANSIGITSSSSDYYAVVAWEKNASPSVHPSIWLRLFGGSNIAEHIGLNKTTGVATSGSSNVDVVLDKIELSQYWLGVMRITDNASGNTLLQTRYYGAASTDGSASPVASVTGSSKAGLYAVYKDAFSLMPILTTGGTTKTVAADVASLTNSIISGLTEGVIYMEIWSPQLTANAARHIAELESDSNNFIRAFIASGGDIDGQITSGGASQAALAGPAHSVGTLHKVALVFGPSGFALYVDGTQEATGTGTVPSVDTLLIGAGLFGGIKTMNVHTSEWSQSKGESETT